MIRQSDCVIFLLIFPFSFAVAAGAAMLTHSAAPPWRSTQSDPGASLISLIPASSMKDTTGLKDTAGQRSEPESVDYILIAIFRRRGGQLINRDVL